MVEHGAMVGELLELLDELGIAESTIVQYSTDNGPHYNTLPDAAITPFRKINRDRPRFHRCGTTRRARRGMLRDSGL